MHLGTLTSGSQSGLAQIHFAPASDGAAMASCSNQVWDAIPNQDLKERPKMIFFVGNNLEGLLAMNKLVPELLKMGIEPVLYLTPGSKSPRAQTPYLQYMDYFTGGVLKDVITPFLDANPMVHHTGKPLRDVFYTFNQLRDFFGIDVYDNIDVKSQDIKHRIKNSGRAIAVYSFKNYAIFDEEMIGICKDKSVPLINIHTGILPEWQGVYIAVYLAAMGHALQGWSAHHVVYDPDLPNKGIDSGDNIDTAIDSFNPYKGSILGETIRFNVTKGSDFILEMVRKGLVYKNFYQSSLKPQDPHSARYHSFPGDDVFERIAQNHISLVNLPEYVDDIVELFCVPGTPQAKSLRSLLTAEVYKWHHVTWPDTVLKPYEAKKMALLGTGAQIPALPSPDPAHP